MHLFSRPAAGKDYYEVFGLQYSQYFRADLSVSRKIMLGEVTALVGRLYGGYGMAYGNSTSIPFDRLFYAGGANSMRGWAPRMLGPGAVPEPEDAVFPTQLGDMKLEANLELRFPIWGMFHGATFVDVGNIWFADPAFRAFARCGFPFRQFLQATGLRCRYRSAPGHQICRTASGLGHTDPQPQCTCRTTVDPQFQVEEYGA